MDSVSNKLKSPVVAAVKPGGLFINGIVFSGKEKLEKYHTVLGMQSRELNVGPPAPVGHSNNRVFLFDDAGIYLTEDQASQLIDSVNFVFDTSEGLFNLQQAFAGTLSILGVPFNADTDEKEVPSTFQRDLPGDYSVATSKCWVSIDAVGRRMSSGTRSKSRYVVSVSVCF